MPFVASAKKSPWPRRIDRARNLAAQNPSSRQLLDFYLHILEFQKGVYERIQPRSEPGPAGGSGFWRSIDLEAAVGHFPALLARVEKEGPPFLAQEAARLRTATRQQLLQMLADGMAEEAKRDKAHTFFCRALLEPYAESLSHSTEARIAVVVGKECPICGGIPQLAVIYPEGDGGKRFLLCSFCQWEWEFRRIWCPACGEENNEKLPRYSAEGIPAVRVEACDLCKRYLKSVDLTIDGLAVPVVDEVATAALDVWATEHGYQKLQLNIVGL